MNPVFRKDILSLLRLKRVVAIYLLYIFLLGALLLVTWPQGGLLSLSARSEDDLLLGLMLGQTVVLILAVPGVAAASLTTERETNTFEMIYASRMSPLEIVLGKLMSAIGFPILLMIAGLPFVGLLAFRGAVNTDILLWSYLILIVTAALLSVLSLTISSLCSHTDGALIVAYLTVLVVCGGALVPAAILLDQLGGPAAAAVHDLRAVSPIAAMLSLLRPRMPGDFNGVKKGNFPSHEIYLLFVGLTILVCTIILVVRLRRPPAEHNLLSPRQTLPRRSFGGGNPILAKEMRTGSFRGGSRLVRIFYGMLVISLLLALMSLYSGAEHADLLRYVFQVLLAFQLIGLAAVAPSLTTPSISSEIESGTFEMLRLTQLGGGQIFWGKLLPACAAAMLPLVALLPAYATVCFVNPAYIQYMLAVLPVILLAMVFCCILGITCSAFTHSSARATVVAYILVTALFALPAVAWWAADAGLLDNARMISWLSLPSPLLTALRIAPANVTSLSESTSTAASTRSVLVPHEFLLAGLSIVLLALSRLRLAFLLRRG